MRFLILMLALYGYLSHALAHTPDEFCKSFETLRTQQRPSHITFGKWLRLQLLPRTVIEAKKIDLIDESALSQMNLMNEGAKYIFVHLPKPKVDLEQLVALQNEEKEISKLKLLEELKNSSNLEDCLNSVSLHQDDFKLINDYLDNYFNHMNELNQLRDSRLYDQLLKKLRVFERKGWKVVFCVDLYQMYKFLEQKKHIEQLMIISHSDQNGRLYDSQKNIFPQGAFSNLKKSIKKLILFSCHGENVVKYYRLGELNSSMQVFFPQLRTNFEEILKDQVPVSSLLGMLDVAELKTVQYLPSKTACALKVKMPVKRDHLFVSLEDHLLGILPYFETKIPFDCKLKRRGQWLIKIFYLGTDQPIPFDTQSISILDELGVEWNLQIKEFLSRNKDHHLLTIGTIGGLP